MLILFLFVFTEVFPGLVLFSMFLDTSQEVIEALRLFGFTSFRQGQEAAIMRVLCGQPWAFLFIICFFKYE